MHGFTKKTVELGRQSFSRAPHSYLIPRGEPHDKVQTTQFGVEHVFTHIPATTVIYKSRNFAKFMWIF